MSWTTEEREQCRRILWEGLEEDLGLVGDITSLAVIASGSMMSAAVIARQDGIAAGLEGIQVLGQLDEAFKRFSLSPIEFEILKDDGAVQKGDRLAILSGASRSVLALERTILNFLCRLGGIATLTARYVEAVKGFPARICDTRKMTPGWRLMEKYAVRVGGGLNHRIGLFDAILIKDNHLADLARHEANPVEAAVTRARLAAPPGTIVEIEVDSLAQLERALAIRPDIVLLDNMSRDQMAQAVRMRDKNAAGVLLEASGGVSLTTVRDIAATGVDRISVGALTHSAPALDLALDDQGVST